MIFPPTHPIKKKLAQKHLPGLVCVFYIVQWSSYDGKEY